jgi:GTPase SAR1 family protein
LPLSERTSTLASGYDVFQSQIEVAGQVFTVDPVVRRKIFDMFKEFNIIVCGSARVGKSTLINAICGQKLAQTNAGLDSCTKAISRYVLQETCRVDNQLMEYTYNFWDTPGFESWNETDIRTNFKKIMDKPKSDPLCMIYCASPGSFADTEQLKWLLDVCIKDYSLLCALVVTNKWAGQKQQRVAVLNKFQELLKNYHPQTSEEDGIIYFGNVALCTMVNSQSYIDEDLNINHEEVGVDELIEGIMTCLDDDGKVFHWCMTVMKKRGILDNYNFKGRMKQRYQDFKHFFAKRFTKHKT